MARVRAACWFRCGQDAFALPALAAVLCASCYSVSGMRHEQIDNAESGCRAGKSDQCASAGNLYRFSFDPDEPSDYNKAAEYYGQACKLDPENGCDGLVALPYELDKKEGGAALSAAVIKLACDLGSAGGCNTLADWYEKGSHGFNDPAKAAQLRWATCLRAGTLSNQSSFSTVGAIQRACLDVHTRLAQAKAARPADVAAGIAEARMELLLADLEMEFQEALWLSHDQRALKTARDQQAAEKKAEEDARRAEEEKASAFPWDVLLGTVLTVAQGVSSASAQLSQIQSAHQATLSRIAQLQALPSQHKTVHWQPKTTVALPQSTPSLSSAKSAAKANKLALAEQRSEQNQAAQQKLQQQQDANAKAQQQQLQEQAKLNLQQCLSTDVNCDYGTSDLCHPSVPYGDRWGARGQFQQALDFYNRCDAADKDNMHWMGSNPQSGPDACKVRVFQLLPDTQELAKQLAKFEKHVSDLPSELAAECPGPQPDPGNSENVRQIRFWCDNKAQDCANSLQTGYDVLEKARQIESCLWTAEIGL